MNSYKKITKGYYRPSLKLSGMAKTADFLDAIKNLGFYSAFKGGLSFNLDDVIIPEEKTKFVRRDMNRLKKY